MKISDAENLSKKYLNKLGFSDEVAKCITQNLIEAELVEKPTHGLIRLPAIKKYVETSKLKVQGISLSIISERPGTLHVDGGHQSGFYVIYKSLELAFEKMKSTGILAVGLKDLAYASGYIGDYARRAAEQGYIFLGFNNSPGSLIPHGSIKNIWGTNPLTIGIPAHKIPVILDMASAKTTWGNILVAHHEGNSLPENVALDAEGNATIDPVKAMEGGILPIAGHKGSGLAFIIELLGGALTNSRVGNAVEGGWGSFYILINPEWFRPLSEFKDDVEKAVQELKSTPKAKGVNEVYFPGEQSFLKRQQHIQTGEIEVSEKLLVELKSFL